MNPRLAPLFFVLLTTASAQYSTPSSTPAIPTPQRLDALLAGTSIEHSLAQLKSINPTDFDHYTLMKRSRSLQEATTQSPRAILFGLHGDLIVTFNGDPSQAFGNHIESMAFDSSSGLYDFFDVTYTNNHTSTVQKNPAKCMQCHGTNLKALWQPYEVWDGNFGKEDDTIYPQEKIDRFISYGYSEEFINKNQNYLNDYLAFRKVQSDHPRYRHLNFHETSPVYPYSPEYRGDYQFRPNLKLTVLLVKQQRQRILQMLKRDVTCYEGLFEYLALKVLSCGASNEEERLFIDNLNKKINSTYEDLFGKFPEGSFPHFNRNEIAKLLTTMGVDMRDWSLELNPQSWNYFEGYHFLFDYFSEDIQELTLEKFPHLEPQDRPDEPFYACRNLFKNRVSFESDMDSRFLSCAQSKLKRSQFFPKTVAMCMSCHSNGDQDAPLIDFTNRDDLLAHLQKIERRIDPDNNMDFMPPQRKLGANELLELKNYISTTINP